MSGNIHRAPTMGDRDPINLPQICEAVGLPTRYINEDFVAQRIIPCIAWVFSHTEFTGVHVPEDDPILREQFGHQYFDDGVFGSRLQELLDGDDIPLRHQSDSLIRFSAEVVARDVADGSITLPERRSVAVNSHGVGREALLDRLLSATRQESLPPAGPHLWFDYERVDLPAPPQVVVDYGPGLAGRFHIEQQLLDARHHGSTYRYFALCKGPFVNQFLMDYYTVRIGESSSFNNRILGRAYFGREDGLAAASTDFAASQERHAGSPEFADVVIASGIHTVGEAELDVGITNAYKILKPEGSLLIRAPRTLTAGRVGSVAADQMVEMAIEAGFSPRKAEFFYVETGGNDNVPLTPTLSAVFRK